MKIKLEPIVSKQRILDPERFRAEIARATTEVKEGIKEDFRKTTRTWKHQPAWYITRRGYEWFIGTKDKIYGYVDQGTSPHIIKPRSPGGRLHFFGSGFKPKSRVGYIDSYAGKTATKDERFAKVVHHPGTEARQFSVKIAEKWRKKWVGRLRQAIHTAAIK